jgi:hypothetical protein
MAVSARERTFSRRSRPEPRQWESAARLCVGIGSVRASGVERVLEILQGELRLVMANCGTQTIAAIDRSYVATSNIAKRLNFVTHVEGVRSLQEIDRAKRRREGITF